MFFTLVVLCSSAIYKQNVSIPLRLTDSVQCRRGYYFRAWVLYFSFGSFVGKLKLSSYVLLAYIDPIYKYGHAWVI